MICLNKSKKAVFFSFMAIFILIGMMALFSLMFKPQTELLKQSAQKEQIMLADSNLEFFKNSYLENMIRISARYAMASYVQEIYDSQDYIIDCFDTRKCDDDSEEIELLKEYLKNLMVFGNIEGNLSLEKDGLFKEDEFASFTIIEQLKKIRQIYKNNFQLKLIYLDSNLNAFPTSYFGGLIMSDDLAKEALLSKLNIKQDMAFSVNVDFSISFNLSTRSEKVSWHYEDYNYSVDVPLYGLIDPFYIIEPMELFGSDFSLNNTLRDDSKFKRTRREFKELYGSMKYLAAPGLGPSFFQRMIHSRHASECCGIESFVNLNNILGKEIDRNLLPDNWFKRSNVDYMYFYYNITDGKYVFNCKEILGQDDKQLYYFGGLQNPYGNPAYFNLDNYHVQKYNVTGILTSGLCEYSWECQNDTRCTPQDSE